MSHRAKTTKYASDDHAGDLLADILASTEEAAALEQQAVEDELEARRKAEEQAKAEAHATRIAERQAKLERELERQDELAKRRTMRMQALSAPEEPEVAEEPSTPSIQIDEDAIRRQIADEVREELRAIHISPMPEPAPLPQARPNYGIFAAAAAVVIGIVGLGIGLATTSYKPDPNPYAKAVFAPMDRNVVALEVGSTPIPKLEEIAAPTPEPVKAKRPMTNRVKSKPKVEKPKSAFAKPAEKSKAATSYDKLKSMLDDSTDPFSMD